MPKQSFEDFYNKAKTINFVQYKTYYQGLQYEKLYNKLTEIKNNLGSNISALDWGGGQGHCSLLLSYLKFKTTLFSIVKYEKPWELLSRKGVEIAFHPKFIKNLNFKDKSFNISVSCGVLEHVRETGGDEIESLKELCRITKDFIVIYHFPNKYSWIEWFTRSFRSGVYSHPYRYTKSEINNMVKQIEDFEIDEISLYGFLPRRIGKIVKNRNLGYLLHLLDKFLSKTILKNVGQAYYIKLKAKNFENT